MNKVLVSVLKDQKDLDILLNEKWYRIPQRYAPKKKYDIIAFYQPAVFKEEGKRIQYYGIVRSRSICKRKKLVKDGERPEERYYKISFYRIIKLKHPVINDSKMRVSFKYCMFSKLYESKSISDLFDVADIESMVEKILKEMGLKFEKEFSVKTENDKRYRLDFAVFHKDKKINIECDSEKWHSLKAVKLVDEQRDEDLRMLGFEILRLCERDIINNENKCKSEILTIIKKKDKK